MSLDGRLASLELAQAVLEALTEKRPTWTSAEADAYYRADFIATAIYTAQPLPEAETEWLRGLVDDAGTVRLERIK